MKYIENLLTHESIIGEFGAESINRSIHTEVRTLADGLNIKTHYLEFNAVDLSQPPSHDLILSAAQWLLHNSIDTVLSPAHAWPSRQNRAIGTLAMRAAMHAATISDRTIDVFELLNLHGLRGNWTVNGTRQNDTYSRQRVGAVSLAAQAFESYVAAQF